MAFDWLKPELSNSYVDNFVELVYADEGFDLTYDLSIAIEGHGAGNITQEQLDDVLFDSADDTIFEDIEP